MVIHTNFWDVTRTAVNTFSLPCVAYYARQRTVSCVAFSQSARQSSLLGKNASGTLRHALGQNVHSKGGAVRIPVFVVCRRRTAKSAIPVVIGEGIKKLIIIIWIWT
jgi:hypothetical protein